MKIIEARDGFIKFETEEDLGISSFVKVQGDNKNYIAQVIQVKDGATVKIAYAKLLFIYDGTFKSYDKTLPSVSAELTIFPFGLVCANFDYKKPIIAGKFIDNESAIPLDIDCFDNKVLISVDSFDSNNTILANLAKQFSTLGNVVVIDMLGSVKGKKYIAGVDFKLPLNTDSLEFMYEDCLNDATADSKDMIKDIFQDLSEYSKSVPFLPFGTLKTIVDDLVEKSHIFKLLVLKNKLAKFDKLGYFASKANEAENLTKILNRKAVVIDVSKLDIAFQNRYLSVIYSELEKLNPKPQVFVEASNSINKKNIKNILTNESVKSVFITHSKFKYLKEIKNLFKNILIESTLANKEVFNIYTPFLSSMHSDEYLIVGEGTNYIPLLAKTEPFDVTDLSLQTIEKELSQEVSSDNLAEEVINEEEVVNEEEFVTLELDEVEKDEQTEAIEKKAEDLIEKVSADVEDSTTENIFEDSDENIQVEEDDSIDETVNDEKEPIIEPLPEFHTEVDSTKAEDIVSDLTQDSTAVVQENVLTEEPLIEDEEEVIELSEESAAMLDEEDSTTESVDEVQLQDYESVDTVENKPSEEQKTAYDSQQNIDEITEISADELEIEDSISVEPEVISLNDDSDFDEIVELDDSEASESDIIVDIDDEPASNEPIKEYNDNLIDNELETDPVEQEIMEDVNKVYTTVKDDAISDSDLDFIDELNDIDSELTVEETDSSLEEAFGEDLLVSDDSFEPLEELPAEENTLDNELTQPLEELSDSNSQANNNEKEILETRESSTPIVPVYDAEIPEEDKVVSDPIEQGDTVVHAKYGTGVVEKMIKYGTKELYSINFDNVGRRLLDPTLTEIKKA